MGVVCEISVKVQKLYLEDLAARVKKMSENEMAEFSLENEVKKAYERMHKAVKEKAANPQILSAYATTYARKIGELGFEFIRLNKDLFNAQMQAGTINKNHNYHRDLIGVNGYSIIANKFGIKAPKKESTPDGTQLELDFESNPFPTPNTVIIDPNIENNPADPRIPGFNHDAIQDLEDQPSIKKAYNQVKNFILDNYYKIVKGETRPKYFVRVEKAKDASDEIKKQRPDYSESKDSGGNLLFVTVVDQNGIPVKFTSNEADKVSEGDVGDAMVLYYPNPLNRLEKAWDNRKDKSILLDSYTPSNLLKSLSDKNYNPTELAKDLFKSDKFLRNTVRSYMNTNRVSEETALKNLLKQMNEMQAIRNKVKAGQDVLLPINGGGRGVALRTYNSKQSLKKLDVTFKIKGNVASAVKNGVEIRAIKPALGSVSEKIKNNIIALATDENLTIDGKPITIEKRKKLLQKFIFSGLTVEADPNNSENFVLVIAGQGRQLTKGGKTTALNNFMSRVTETKISPEMAAKVDKSLIFEDVKGYTDEISYYVKKDGGLVQLNRIRLNIPFTPEVYDVDGSNFTSPAKQLNKNDYIKENAFTEYELNGSGTDLAKINTYLTFDSSNPIDSTQPKRASEVGLSEAEEKDLAHEYESLQLELTAIEDIQTDDEQDRSPENLILTGWPGITPESVKNEIANAKINTRKGDVNPAMTRGKEKGGKSIKEYAHELWETGKFKAQVEGTQEWADLIMSLLIKGTLSDAKESTALFNNELDKRKHKIEERLKEIERLTGFDEIETSENYDNNGSIPDDFPFKIVTQKERNEPVTSAQKAEARAWYKNSPLSKVIPFETMFDMVNTKHPQAIASWSTQGITLYKGSDYTDLYHEAWHGFTQVYLTKNQKAKLYKELGQRTGSFLDQEGTRVTFKKASEKQLEEFLAEDFRSYMLNGQKAVKNSVERNNIFRKIWNALKSLFKFSSVRGIVSDANIDKNIGELYRNLKKGDLSNYSPSYDNTNYTSLAKTGIQVLDESEEPFTLSESLLLAESIDSMLHVAFKNYNNDKSINSPNVAQKSFLADSKSKAYFYGAKYGFNSSVKKQIEKGVSDLKNTIKKSEAFLDKASEVSNLEGSKKRINKAKANLKLLEKTLKNFPEVLKFHSKVSDKFYTEELLLEGEDQSETEEWDIRAGFDQSGNAKSIENSLSSEVKMVLSSLPRTSRKGDYISNQLGFPQMVPLQEVWNKLIKDLEGVVGLPDMIEKLEELSSTRDKSKAVYKELLEAMPKAEEGTELNQEQTQMWTQFWQVFNMSRAEMSIFYINKETNNDGTLTGKYTSRLGFSGGTYTKTKKSLKNKFDSLRQGTKARKEIKKNGLPAWRVEIDPSKLFKENRYGYDPAELRVTPYNFLKAIGIDLTNNALLLEELEKNKEQLKGLAERVLIYDFLQKTYPKEGFGITKFEEFYSRLPEDVIEKLKGVYNLSDVDYSALQRGPYNIGTKESKPFVNTFAVAANEGSRTERTNFSLIIALESDYTYDDNNFQRTNAEGNTQFEHSLNNLLTTITKAVNNPKYDNYYTLMKNEPSLQHLQFNRNPLLKGEWLTRLFDLEFDPNGEFVGTGDRKVDGSKNPIQLITKNLGGINVDYDGVSYASADATSKLISDMHQMLIANVSENVRHADKNTSFSSQTSGNKPYIGLADFGSGNYKEIFIEKYFIKYLANEIERIRKIKTIDKNKPYDKLFEEQGKNFVLLKSIYDKVDSESKELLDNLIDSSLDKNGKHNEFFTMNILDQKFKSDPDLIGLKLNLKKVLFDNTDSYFGSQVEDAKEMLNVTNNRGTESTFFSETLLQKARKEFPDNIGKNKGQRLLTEAFILNSWIDHIEKVNFFYGDLAQYNHAKQDFHKRNAGAGSTGENYRTDQLMMDYLNSLKNKKRFTKKYFASKEDLKDKEPIGYSETMNTAIVENMKIDSAYFNKLVEEYTNQEVARLKKANEKKKANKKVNREKIKAEAIKTFQPYLEMDEADAQGYITLDAYRELKEAQGSWQPEHQEIFDKLLNDEELQPSEIKKFFAPIKAQYWGPLQTDESIMNGLSVNAMHKYSLIPLLPNLIKDTKLQQLNEKMMREDIGYVTFKSGSKLGVLGKNGQPDKIYSNQQARESDIDNSEDFTKNTIFLTYLKDQMDIADEVKGQVIFSTQLRKLVEQGLMRDGIPIDYTGKDEEWDKLTDDQRAKESKIYSVVLEYERNIDTLTDLVKADILKMTGFKQIETQDGISYEPVKKGDYSKLLSFAQSEITRQDFAPNEKSVINSVLNNSNSSDVKDLSYTLSSAQIAKVINSLITKRMINQKVNGESLVQASTSLFEKMKSEGRNFTKPTDEELSKYGTLDLPFYEYNENGTKAMKVKIAMQGQFLNLLKIDGIQVTKPDGTIDEMASLRNLNSKLRDEKWLDEGNNRQMITMNGVRIPVQGLNSMDFMEVYEFLPPGSPNIIIAPSEVVAKSGADFDIDKMTVIMPNILVLNGKALKYTSANIKKAKDQIDKLKKESKTLANKRAADFQRIKKDFIKPADQKRYAKIVGPTEKVIASYEEDLKTLLSDNKELIQTKDLTEEESAELEGVESQIQFIEDEIEQAKQKKYSLIENEFGDAWNKALEKHKEDFNAEQSENKAKIREIGKALSKAEIKMAQNNILTSVVDMLKIPESFGLLTKPNTTADLLSIKNDLSLIKSGVTKAQLAELNKNPEKKKQKIKELDAKFSPTRIFEPLFNLEKHQSNKVGKQILGIIAIDNTFDAIFNRVGFKLNNSGQRSIRFRHNIRKSQEEGSERRETSLSGLYDVDDNFRISDIISQLINGSVDVAKDDWISKIQGNKEAISTLLLLNQAGVPIEEAIYFLSIDSLQDYYKELQLTKSKYAKVLETDPPQGEGVKKISKIRALRNLVKRMESDFSDDYTYEINTINNFLSLAKEMDQSEFNKALNGFIEEQLFTGEDNTNTIFTNDPGRHTKVNKVDLFETLSSAGKGKPKLKNEFKALLHYFELEKPTDAITTLKNTLNVDTTKSGSAYEAYAKKEAIQELLNKDLEYAQYDPEYIEKIMSETAIKGFFVQDLQIALMKGLFPTITSDALLSNLNTILNDSADFIELNRRVKILFGDKESYAKSYVEDFGNYLLQRLIKDFDKAAFKKGSYKGYEVEALPTQELDFTLAPVQIKDGVIYYSEGSLIEAFEKYESTTENNKNEAGELNPPSIVIETIDEYLHFNLERAALKEAIPYKSWLKKNEDNPSIEYQKFASIAEGDLEQAYELAMNSQALFNINNNDNIFRSISEKNSISINYVERFLLIKQQYPELANKINLVNDLESETTNNSDSNGMSVNILTLAGIKLTSVNVANYHNDLQNLSDPDFLRTLELSEDKYINENDINFISNLFSKFTEISIMQSGMKGSSSYALTRIVDHEKLLRLVGPLAKTFNNPVNVAFQEALVEDFSSQFEIVNSDKYLRTRNKNYKSEGENSRVSNIYEALENPNQTFTSKTFADDIFSTPQIVWDNAAYKTLQKDFSSNTAPRLLAINGPTNVSILNTSVRKENNISDLAGIFKPGVEISSNAKGLGAALTNPTELAKSRGNITQSYPVEFNGKTYKDVEQAYQALKHKSEAKTKPTKETSKNYKLMVDLIKAKLQQHPRLVSEINKKGGSAWILSSTHQPTLQDTVWETGGQNWFIESLADAYNAIAQTTQPEAGVNVISEDYGVVQVETNPTKDKKEQFLDIIRPQIQAQTYKENVGKGANQMFHFGKMWSRVNAKSKPIKIKSFAPVGNRDKLIDAGQDAKGNTLGINEYTYAYHELDQNGNPLPSMSALQPIIDEISQSLGIDMSDYDSLIGNIYQPGEFIYPHKDVTESKSAEKYPVIVYTIGANAGLGIVDNNKGKMTFANQYDDRYLKGNEKLSGYTNEILTKDGTIYTFGMGGKGRFQLTHSTPINDAKKGDQPPITLPNGQVITNYTITLTFRRSADLTKGVPEEPKRFEPTPSTPTAQAGVKKVNSRLSVSQEGSDGFGYVLGLFNSNQERIGKIVYRSKTYLKDKGFPYVNELHLGFEEKYQGKGYFQDALIELLNYDDSPIFISNGRVINDNVFKAINKLDASKLNVNKIENGYIITLNTQITPQQKQEAPGVNVEYIKSPKNIFSVKPIKGRPDKKATIKSSIATQYIGFAEGIAGSSTASYASDAGFFANTGNYGSEDVIFVSIGGKRGGVKVRKEQQDKTIKEAIKAVEAGATIITDNVNYIHYNSKTKKQRPITLSVKEFEQENGLYNLGEKRLYENMKAKGYNYSEVTIDGQTLGTWSKSEQPAQQTSEVETYSGKVDISNLKENEDTVFGSNQFGFHGGGTAGILYANDSKAYKKQDIKGKGLRVEVGKARGFQTGIEGSSYALQTVTNWKLSMNDPKRQVPKDEIIAQIKEMYDYYRKNSDRKAYVLYTTGGKNLNGYTSLEMAEMFAAAGPIPSNVIFNEKLISLVDVTQPQADVSYGKSVDLANNAIFLFDKATDGESDSRGSRMLSAIDNSRVVGLPTLLSYTDSLTNIPTDVFKADKPAKKILTDEVVEEFNGLGFKPSPWFFSKPSRVFIKPTEGSGRYGKQNHNTKFVLDKETQLYNFVNMETKEILLRNINLSTGMQEFPGTGGLVANQTLVDEVDKITDAVLDKMNKEGYSVVLPKTGIAQELVRAYPRDSQNIPDLMGLGEDMPTLKPDFKALVEEGNTEQLKTYGVNTFIEISKILYDKFGYINPNFVKFQEGKDYLLSRSGQVPISNDVTNSLRDSCK